MNDLEYSSPSTIFQSFGSRGGAPGAVLVVVVEYEAFKDNSNASLSHSDSMATTTLAVSGRVTREPAYTTVSCLLGDDRSETKGASG